MQTSHNENDTFFFDGYDCKLNVTDSTTNGGISVTIVPAATEANADRGVDGNDLATLSLIVDSDNIETDEFAANVQAENARLLEIIIVAGLAEATRKSTKEGHPIIRFL